MLALGLAEQLVAYRLFGHGSGQDMGFAEYTAGEAWYVDWLGDMARFFGWSNEGRVRYAPEQCSWVGRSVRAIADLAWAGQSMECPQWFSVTLWTDGAQIFGG